MYDMTINQSALNVSLVDSSMRLQFAERISGVSYNGSTLRIHFYEPYAIADETAAQAIIDAHDPVFIMASRSGDDVTVTLSKPRNLDSATELTLTIDGEAAPEATALTDNAAAVEIESADAITIGIVEDYPYLEVTI